MVVCAHITVDPSVPSIFHFSQFASQRQKFLLDRLRSVLTKVLTRIKQCLIQLGSFQEDGFELHHCLNIVRSYNIEVDVVNCMLGVVSVWLLPGFLDFCGVLGVEAILHRGLVNGLLWLFW